MEHRIDIEEQIKGMNPYTAYDFMKKCGFSLTEPTDENANEVYYENLNSGEYAYWRR